jgi:putative Ca2+/H+ antiporter (TMEM165/GDT1 family)
MKAQRRVVFTRLLAAATLMTLIAFFSGVSIFLDVAALAWFCVVLFVALALYAVSQGYLSDESLKVHLPQRRQVADVEPMYVEPQEQYVYYDDEFESEFYEPETSETWQREPERRRALG